MKKYDELPYYAIKSMYYTIVTDENGLVKILSKNYQELLGMEEKDYVGKPVQNIIKNSEIPRVLKNRK